MNSVISIKTKDPQQTGMTLLEIMVTMSMMTVIILGLYSMFNRTSQALLDGTTQVDVLENARAVGNLASRDLEQAAAMGNLTLTNLAIGFSPGAIPVANTLLDGSVRTAALHQVFFMVKGGAGVVQRNLSSGVVTNDVPESGWRSVGYVAGPLPGSRPEDLVLWTNGVGALYRYEKHYNPLDIELVRTNTFKDFLNCMGSYACVSNEFRLVSEGVVSFAVTAYDTNGVALTSNSNLPYYFTNNEIPAYLDLEFGVLEPRTLENARLFAFTNNPSLSRSILATNTDKVHLFRHRITIRTQQL